MVLILKNIKYINFGIIFISTILINLQKKKLNKSKTLFCKPSRFSWRKYLKKFFKIWKEGKILQNCFKLFQKKKFKI